MIDTLIDIGIIVTLLVGSIFTFVGSIGLLKLDSSMKRLHAPTKASTLGIGALLTASILHSWGYGDGTFHEVLILAFLFVTAPISANFIAKVHLHRECVDPVPPPPGDMTWATYDHDASDAEKSPQA